MLNQTIAQWTLRDVKPADRAEYEQIISTVEATLQPGDGMEVFLAVEVVRDLWRLRFYAARTAEHGPSDDLDKARTRTSTNIRRTMAEIRRLQTERQLRSQLGPRMTGLGSTRELVEVSKLIRSYKPKETNPVDRLESAFQNNISRREANLKKQTHLPSQPHPTIGRNTPCPCGSGQKHKRCCGKGAPPLYHQAA
jgi:hypothetical protein